jgi:hypothetical protein
MFKGILTDPATHCKISIQNITGVVFGASISCFGKKVSIHIHDKKKPTTTNPLRE